MKLIDDIRADNMKLLQAEYGSVKALADHLGKSESQVSQWINRSTNSGTGKPRAMRSSTARGIEAACGKPVGWMDIDREKLHVAATDGANVLLLTDAERRAAATESNVAPGPDIKGRVPLISWVQAGVWNEAVDIYEPGYADEWLPILSNGSPHAFALRVQGDSMTSSFGKSYPEGCIIIVNPDQRSPVTGQRIVAKLAGSNAVTFKVFVEEDGKRWLKPLNPQHPPIYDEFRVLGTVTGKFEPD